MFIVGWSDAMKKVNYLTLRDTQCSCVAYGMKVYGGKWKNKREGGLLWVAVHAPPGSLTLTHCVIFLQPWGCGVLAVAKTMMMMKVHQWI